MPLDYSATTHDVLVPASTSIANLSVKTFWAWIYLRTYTGASGWRLFQKGYVGRNGFAHYCGGGTTAFEYQYFRTGGGGLNFAANYTSFASWAGNKYLFVCVITDGGSGTKLYVGDLKTPPAEPSAYSFSSVGSAAFYNDSAIALDWGNRGGSAVNLDGYLHSSVWIPSVLPYKEIKTAWSTPPKLWGPLYQNAACGIWRFGSNGRGIVLDESGKSNHGTLTGAVPISDNLPRVYNLGDDLGRL